MYDILGRNGGDIMDSIGSKLADILERTVRVETKLDNLTDISNTADHAERLAYDAQSSVRSAHKRLDKIDKYTFWLTSTVIGFIILGILSIIFLEV